MRTDAQCCVSTSAAVLCLQCERGGPELTHQPTLSREPASAADHGTAAQAADSRPVTNIVTKANAVRCCSRHRVPPPWFAKNWQWLSQGCWHNALERPQCTVSVFSSCSCDWYQCRPYCICSCWWLGDVPALSDSASYSGTQQSLNVAATPAMRLVAVNSMLIFRHPVGHAVLSAYSQCGIFLGTADKALRCGSTGHKPLVGF